MKLPFAFEKEQDSSETDYEGHSDLEVSKEANCPKDQSIQGLSDLYFPEEADESHVHGIVEVLVDMGKLTSGQCIELQQQCRRAGGTLDSDVEAMLLKEGLVGADDILIAKADLYGLEFRHIIAENVEKEVLNKSGLDIDFVKNNLVCPVAIEEGTLVVGTCEPANVFAIEDVKRQSQMPVQMVVCSSEDIESVCNSFKTDEIDYCVDDIISDMADVEVVQDEEDISEDLEEMAGQSPVIKFVNYLISNAIHEGASDIHIEPKDKSTKIRYRIDGVLFEMMQSPLKMHPAIVSRIKIMSNLDISERRLPQDGKISVIVGGRAIDLRVSILPTSHGEKVVIRVLDSKSIIRGLEQLGMESEVRDAFSGQIAMPHGIMLVTGPTGSGKSTTLYSALCQMDGDKLNISTVEDPVEYELGFCNQVQANEKIGLDFASALRSLLRQDPDIIMIGEIRDNETARIAVQAALTGHLVLSTLHTNDAASSITRLVNIGIDPYLIAASLNAVLAQRLVRKICSKCKEIYQVPENMRKYVENSGAEAEQLFRGVGCDYCRGSGYVGRVGIYELLIIDDIFRDMINKDSSVSNMRRVFHESRQASLFEDGIKKIKQGLTTLEEVLRVTEMYGQSEEEVFVENID
ncbi:MAG: GspE/PulE family protein [Planctomycetota bacterium]|jgi:type IV pilus assembly protein PilB